MAASSKAVDGLGHSDAPRSDLLQLDQRTEEVLRMEEKHRLSMCTNLRLAIAKHPRPRCPQPVSNCKDIIDLVADVVHAASGILFKKGRNRRRLAKRLQQLNL